MHRLYWIAAIRREIHEHRRSNQSCQSVNALPCSAHPRILRPSMRARLPAHDRIRCCSRPVCLGEKLRHASNHHRRGAVRRRIACCNGNAHIQVQRRFHVRLVGVRPVRIKRRNDRRIRSIRTRRFVARSARSGVRIELAKRRRPRRIRVLGRYPVRQRVRVLPGSGRNGIGHAPLPSRRHGDEVFRYRRAVLAVRRLGMGRAVSQRNDDAPLAPTDRRYLHRGRECAGLGPRPAGRGCRNRKRRGGHVHRTAHRSGNLWRSARRVSHRMAGSKRHGRIMGLPGPQLHSQRGDEVGRRRQPPTICRKRPVYRVLRCVRRLSRTLPHSLLQVRTRAFDSFQGGVLARRSR